MTKLHPAIEKVTARIVENSRDSRRRYLDMIAREGDKGVNRATMSCGNLAHGFAASGDDKPAIRTVSAMNIGIVTAYNDMLSAHQPYGRYPEHIKRLRPRHVRRCDTGTAWDGAIAV
jgi:phosphogluconate dehydratase